MSEPPSYKCRLCTKSCKFGYSLLVGDINEIVQSFTTIKIEENDALPSSCCADCLEDVYLVFRIRCRIIEADRVLRHERLDSIKRQEVVPCKKEPCEKPAEDSPQVPEPPKPEEAIPLDQPELVPIAPQVSNKRPPVNHKKPPVSDKNPLVSDNKPPVNHKKPPVSDKKPPASDKKPPLPHPCTVCHMRFTGHNELKRHILTHDIKRMKQCELCDRQVLACNYRRHLDLHKASPQVCELCGAVAKNAESLRGHMFYMHKSTAEQYKCEHCGKTYRYKYKFELHLRKAHGGDRSHICEVCGKAFFSGRDVNRHVQMTHLKLRPYICSYCNKGFSSAYARNTHVRQHTNEKPFNCDVCAEGFRQRVSLKTHMKSKHGLLYVKDDFPVQGRPSEVIIKCEVRDEIRDEDEIQDEDAVREEVAME